MRRSPPLPALLAATLAISTLGLSPPCDAATHVPRYPRLSLYGSIMGDGYPFCVPGGMINTTTLDEVSRYHNIILDVNPISPYRPDIINGLRFRNPDATIFAYVLGHVIWNAQDADSLHHFPTRYRRLVRDLDGFLYNRNGGEFTNSNVNLAKRDSTGRFVVAEGLADLFHDAIYQTGMWDGIFIDIICDNICWSQDPAESIDVQRAGYSSDAELDQAWHAASDTLCDRLRRLCGPDFILVGNCAVGTKYDVFNGWMREDFPYEQGANWYQNMFQDPGGYMLDDQRFQPPRYNYLFSAAIGTNPYDPQNTRKVRWGLGSATLADGFGVFGTSWRSALMAPYHEWWYDEYAVDIVTGRASTLRQNTGWLGEALGPWYQMIWVGNQPDAVSNPDFETNLLGWNFWHNVSPGSTFARDGSTSAKGNFSGHVHVTAPTAADWQITLSSVGQIPLQQGSTYSATFWAKASSTRQVPVLASRPGGGAFAARTIQIGTTWKQYQIEMVPAGSGLSSLQFYLGRGAGDVWLDDIHFQQGVTNLYRRDFQNGSVLVNPTFDQWLTVSLERPFRKILGLSDPVVNDGSLVTQVTVGASDALFLISNDVTPPAAVRDLHQIANPTSP